MTATKDQIPAPRGPYTKELYCDVETGYEVWRILDANLIVQQVNIASDHDAKAILDEYNAK